MKKFEIAVSGEHEEEIGLEILRGIYEAVQNHGYTDVSVKADTIEEMKKGSIQMPEFLTPAGRGKLECQMAMQKRGC